MVLNMRQILLILHILLGVIWVGGVLFVGWGVYPAVRKFAYTKQRLLLISLMQWTHKLFALAGFLVIVTGTLLGTIFGPIHQLEQLLGIDYGRLFTLALIIAPLTLAWGVFVGYRQTMQVLQNESLWRYAEIGSAIPLNQRMFTVAVLTAVEVFGMVALITIMVLF